MAHRNSKAPLLSSVYITFLCAAAKKKTKKAALLRTAPHAKEAMLRVVVVGQTALRKLSLRFFLGRYSLEIRSKARWK